MARCTSRSMLHPAVAARHPVVVRCGCGPGGRTLKPDGELCLVVRRVACLRQFCAGRRSSGTGLARLGAAAQGGHGKP